MKLSKQTLIKIGFIAVVLAIAIPSAIPAKGDSLDAQINELKRRAASLQQEANGYQQQANDYKGKVNTLQSEIELIRTQISLSQAKYTKVSQEVEQAKEDLITQKTILDENIRDIYKQGELNSIEILASSDNFSDFVNKQEYSQKVKDKVQASFDRITALKQQLEKQQTELAGLLRDQQSQRAQLESKQAETNQLLAVAQESADKANAQVRDTNSQVARLRAQQAAAIAAVSGGQNYGGSGGYPWANAPWPNSIPDSWGMYQRQCVSYTAWKVASTRGYMPYWGGRGNANQWPANARNAGIPVDGNPRPGDVGILMSGTYGHAVYVESVNGNSVFVSQYNANWDGRYSTSTYPKSSLVYIHF